MNYWQPPPTAFRRWLDAFVALPARLRLPLAVLLALLIHALVVLLAWVLPLLLWLVTGMPPDAEVVVVKEQRALEVVVQPEEPKLAPEPKKEELTPVEEARLQELFAQLPVEEQRDYVDVDGLARKKNLSKRALFESWQDSVAGSRKPGKGNEPLPSQDGRDDLPFTNFKNQQAVVGDPKKPAIAESEEDKRLTPTPDPAGALYAPQPIPKPDLAKADQIPKTAEAAKPAPAPAPAPPAADRPVPPPDLKEVVMAKADEIPLFLKIPELTRTPPLLEPTPPPPKPTPQPILQPTPEPVPKPTPPPPVPKKSTIVAAKPPQNPGRPQPVQNPGYTPHQEKRKIEGGNAPGDDGVDAVETVKGRYMKSLNMTLGSRWTHYVKNDPKYASLITFGTVSIRFTMNAKGKFTRVRVTENTSNAAHAALCQRVFAEAQPDIDPPPPQLLRGGVFEDTFDFTLYHPPGL